MAFFSYGVLVFCLGFWAGRLVNKKAPFLKGQNKAQRKHSIKEIYHDNTK